jgi:hypothetical protein
MYAKASSSLSAVARLGRLQKPHFRRSQPSWPLFPEGPKTRPELGKSAPGQLDECIALIAPIEKSHASLAQFRTETKYASLSGERGCRIHT